jgi:hypothetical protein
MKTILQKSIMIAILYYVFVIIGCIEGRCPPTKIRKFAIEDIYSRLIKFQPTGDSTFIYTPFAKDSIDAKNYGIQILFQTKELVKYSLPKWSVVNSALAKCSGDYYKTDDTLSKLTINTLYSFDSAHPSGSDVTEYFKYLEYQYNPTKIIRVSVADLITKISVTDFMYSIPLILNQVPEFPNSKAQFEIITLYKSGKIFKDTTTLVTLM